MVSTRSMSLLLCVMLLTSTGCGLFGRRARENALRPALLSASVGIEQDATLGIRAIPLDEHAGATAAVRAFYSSLQSTPIPPETIGLWPAVSALCEAGFVDRVDRQEIGPNVAESLRERLRNFEQALIKYMEGK